MTAFWLLCRLRLFELLRNRSSLGFFVGLPLLLLLATGGMFADGHPFERRQLALVMTSPASPMASARRAAVAGTLAAYHELHVVELPDAELGRGQLRSRTLDGLLLIDHEGALRLQVGERRQLLALALKQILPSPLAVESLEIPRFGYVHHLLAGLLAFSILTTGLLGMGAAMARYRHSQLLKKLALTPLRRSTFVAAQLTSRTLLGLLQVAVLLLAARLLFALPISPATALGLLAVSGLGLLTFMGIGFLIAAAIRSEGLLLEVVSALMTPLVLLSEMFFPLSELPPPLRLLGESLPSTQLVRLLRLGIHAGFAVDSSIWLPSLALLLGWLLLSYLAAVACFRWTD
jgi:ABC-type multidrug transport system permease subunit